MKQSNRHVLVIGGGIAGLAAALDLTALDYPVTLVEQSGSLGGHTAQFCCKATDQCAQCGACIVAEKISRVADDPNIAVLLKNRIKRIEKKERLSISLEKSIDPDQGKPHNRIETDAIIAATGFQPFDPTTKPYGYARFKDVITQLELERMLKKDGSATRPCDGKPPKKMAFIQCVGSRDAKLNHLWCSKVCCCSTLRTAKHIRWKQPNTEITVFYIDIQTCGNNFQEFFQAVRKDIRMIRTLPGDIFKTKDNRLRLSFYETRLKEEFFDLVVLSVAQAPCEDNYSLFQQLGLKASKSAFCRTFETAKLPLAKGVFAAGAVTSPMSIADSIASAGKAARDVVNYFSKRLSA